jgi:protein-tyrosine phosphatase
VYIHCAFGRGRSATVAAAVLLRLSHARNADEAVELLVRARPIVRVKGAQYIALARYADVLRERQGAAA